MACAVALAACADDGGPRLDMAAPSAARANERVTLTGRRLCDGDCATAAGEIQLGLSVEPVRVAIAAYDDTSATIAIPPAAPVGATSIIVVVNGRSSNALDFEVLP